MGGGQVYQDRSEIPDRQQQTFLRYWLELDVTLVPRPHIIGFLTTVSLSLFSGVRIAQHNEINEINEI